MSSGLSIVGLAATGVVIGGGLLWGIPAYKVYTAEQDGKAILARAESSKKAQIANAEAQFQASKYLKQAADEIQGSLSPQYLRFLEIQMQEEVGSKNDRAVYFMDAKTAPVVPVPAK